MSRSFVNAEAVLSRSESDLIMYFNMSTRCTGARMQMFGFARRFSDEFGYRPQSRNLYQYQWTKEKIADLYARIALDLTLYDIVSEDEDHQFVLNRDIAIDLFRQHLDDLGHRTMTDVVADGMPLLELAAIDKYCGHVQMLRGWENAHKAAVAWIAAHPVDKAA